MHVQIACIHRPAQVDDRGHALTCNDVLPSDVLVWLCELAQQVAQSGLQWRCCSGRGGGGAWEVSMQLHAWSCMQSIACSPCNGKLARTCERGCARAQKTNTRVHASGSDDATSVPNAVNALTCSRVAHRLLLTTDVDHTEFDRMRLTAHAENCQLWEIALLQLFVGTACSIAHRSSHTTAYPVSPWTLARCPCGQNRHKNVRVTLYLHADRVLLICVRRVSTLL
jgi:hypothetical protein